MFVLCSDGIIFVRRWAKLWRDDRCCRFPRWNQYHSGYLLQEFFSVSLLLLDRCFGSTSSRCISEACNPTAMICPAVY
jgi:hypothetical protein